MQSHDNPAPESAAAGELPCKKRSAWLLLGICGSGMRAFAEMLLDAGQTVVGTDTDRDGLSRLQTLKNPLCSLIPWPTELPGEKYCGTSIVHSLAVPANSPLLIQARQLNLKVSPLPVAMGEFLKDSRQICVAGTHGKTTTTGMIWWILQQAGLKPAGYIGGEFLETHRSGAFGAGQTSVIESCEYRQSFLQLNPQTAVLTGIEPDHFDCFDVDQAADSAFRSFIERIPADGTLIVNADNSRSLDVARKASCSVFSFGGNTASDWMIRNLETDSCRTTSSRIGSPFPAQVFEIFHCGKSVAEVGLQVPGLHNVENATAAFVAAMAEGLPPDEISRHLGSFSGIHRRFEYRGTWRGVDLIDDYAHHPSAISATLRTARSCFPGRRLIAIFEPHQVSRTERLFSEFIQALTLFDECLVLPVLPARENASSAECCRISGRLVRRISEAGGRAFLMANLDQVPGRLDHAARPGDVVITMGAGRTNQIHDEIHRRLLRDSAA
jgi:UDP-N-acetylmuramate--alanine ligase